MNVTTDTIIEFRAIDALRGRIRAATQKRRERLMLELEIEDIDVEDHPLFAASEDMVRSWAYPPPDVCALAGVEYVAPPRLN